MPLLARGSMCPGLDVPEKQVPCKDYHFDILTGPEADDSLGKQQ